MCRTQLHEQKQQGDVRLQLLPQRYMADAASSCCSGPLFVYLLNQIRSALKKRNWGEREDASRALVAPPPLGRWGAISLGLISIPHPVFLVPSLVVGCVLFNGS